MAYTFNAPPNWPQPPEGWRPGPGWQPDPSWGPAPEGWVFWKDEQGRPVGPDGVPVDPAPGSREADVADGSAAAGSGVGGTRATASGAGEPAPGEPAPLGTADGAGPDAPENAASGGGRQDDGWAAASAASARDPEQGWAGAAPAGSGAAAGAGGATGAGGGGWGGADAGGPGGTPQEPPRKKSFFTSTAGILSIIGAVLLILIVVLVIVLVGFFRSAGDPVADDDREVGPSVSASASSSSSPSESSSSPSESSQAPASGDPGARPSGTRPDQGIEATTADPVYSFNGRGEQRVEADLDPNTLYYVEYWYQGDSNFIVWGLDAGEEGDLLANEIGTTAGSHWVDPDDFYSTEGFSIDADDEGVWELKVYDTQALGISEDQDEAVLSGSVAFGYTGDGTTATFAYRSGKEGLTVTGYSMDGETLFTESIEAGSDTEVKLPASSEDDPVLVQVESTYGETEWSLAFE
ncbi:hypothetical protein [Rothia halotolerans]|uniref:hypothetical protein n=1 Tax=Rothia halotolerans TaxID=405770 RepID=UPI00101D0557|nr:hypothetical protein [Rothia halotolerans]